MNTRKVLHPLTLEDGMHRKLVEVTVVLTSDSTFDLEFYEPESGDFVRHSGKDTDGPELSQRMGNEILSWVSIMRDELDEERGKHNETQQTD